jgi:hypothetical protein
MEIKATAPALIKWMVISSGVKVLSEKAGYDYNSLVLNTNLSING